MVAYESTKSPELRNATTTGAVSGPSQHHSGYQTVQAMGKVIKRVGFSLPSSPLKHKAVAAPVAQELGLEVLKPSNSPHVGNPTFDEKTKAKEL